MSQSRVRVNASNEFNPREWLRREVLWASLMTPYNRQLATWIEGTALPQHLGNSTRQKIYGEEPDAEAQSLAFFNQGKSLAGLISSVALFDACLDRTGYGAHVNILGVQARSVDKVLERAANQFSRLTYSDEEEAEIFAESSALAKTALQFEYSHPARNEAFFKAGIMMVWLASSEAASWIDNSKQNPESSLPTLLIEDGGTPRSGGDRVNKLQPIFKKLIDSNVYTDFARI